MTDAEAKAFYRKRFRARYLRSRLWPSSRRWRRDLALGIRQGPFRNRWEQLPVFERHVLVSASGRAFDDTLRRFGAATTVQALGLTCDEPIAPGGNLILTARTGALGALAVVLAVRGHNVAFSSAHPEHRRRLVLPKVGERQRGLVTPLFFPSWQAILSARRGLESGWDFIVPIDSIGEPGTTSFHAEFARLPDRTERLFRVLGNDAARISFMCVEVVDGWRPKLKIICHQYSGEPLEFLRRIESSLERLPHQWHVWTALGAASKSRPAPRTNATVDGKHSAV
ncbi:hypothetical protein [Kribbella speibonae]|uniref:Uncharacterized protein n=1 Tax=Kribbella speibonae TaxID=1572660 RepID=A0A4R0IUV2_9ACTN|nr:hypothetical protein [Kribbella speibonae]TCC36304.1 hypothetical protein E0H92_27000 [Kribbella speibonae]